MHWEILSTEYLYKHPPYFIARKDVCRQPNGHIVPAYYVIELPVSVITFPVVENKVLMIKQYRHPIGEVSWEFPGGFVDEGEDTMGAAKRELKEETGFVFDHYHYLGKIAGNPGILNNLTHVYIASGAHQTGKQDFDSHEDIETAWFTLEQVKELLLNNQVIQSLHANAAYMALLHLGKLQFIS